MDLILASMKAYLSRSKLGAKDFGIAPTKEEKHFYNNQRSETQKASVYPWIFMCSI